MPVRLNPLENVYLIETAADLPDVLSQYVIYNLRYDPAGEGVGLYFSFDGVSLAPLLAPWSTPTITGSWIFESNSGSTSVHLRKRAATDSAIIVWQNEIENARFTAGLGATASDDWFLGRYNESGVWQDAPIYVYGIDGLVEMRTPVEFQDIVTLEADTIAEADLDVQGVFTAVEFQRKVKSADEAVNNSVTMQDDDDLTAFLLVADKHYRVEVFLKVTCPSAVPLIKTAFVFSLAPSSQGRWTEWRGTTTGNLVSGDLTAAVTTSSVSNAAHNVTRITGFFQANSSGGTLKLQWAQVVATVADTIVTEGSYMIVEQLD